MGRSPVPTNPRIINSLGANNMTGTAIVLSNVIDMLFVDLAASVELKITGTPTGTLSFEGSDQYDPVNNSGATFVPLAGTALTPALTNPAGAGSTQLMALTAQALGCRYVRLRYVNTSSTGVLDAWFHGRGQT
jgi:hypothetical protein